MEKETQYGSKRIWGEACQRGGRPPKKVPRRARRQYSSSQPSVQLVWLTPPRLGRRYGWFLPLGDGRKQSRGLVFSCTFQYMNELDEQGILQMEMESEGYFSKAWTIWKELQATELWQWSGSHEPAGCPDLEDTSLRPPVCGAVSREEGGIALVRGADTEPMRAMSSVRSHGPCGAHTALAGVKACQPNEKMMQPHQEGEQFPSPCICGPSLSPSLHSSSTNAGSRQEGGQKGKEKEKRGCGYACGHVSILGLLPAALTCIHVILSPINRRKSGDRTTNWLQQFFMCSKCSQDACYAYYLLYQYLNKYYKRIHSTEKD